MRPSHNRPFADMTYLGLTYRTPYGTYTVPHSNALEPLGHHSFQDPTRDEFVTHVDPGIQEAHALYPAKRDPSFFEGWSRSFYTKDAHKAALQQFASAPRFQKPFNDPSWKAVDEHCIQLFDSFPKVQAINFDTNLKDVAFQANTSAGIGLPGRKGDGDNHKRAMAQASATVYNFMDGKVQEVIEQSTPDRAFTRTQLTDTSEKTKVRHVFGQAFQYILIEGTHVQPLLEAFSSIDSPYFIGHDPRIAVPQVIEEFALKQGVLFSTDWSHFDASAEHWEIEDYFNLIERMLIFPTESSKACFEFSKLFLINRKIAGPDHELYFKHRGIPSGSFHTNCADSWINYRRIQYMYHRITGQILDPTRLKVCFADLLIRYVLLNRTRSWETTPLAVTHSVHSSISIEWSQSSSNTKISGI